jgi:site-specific recombinase XerD
MKIGMPVKVDERGVVIRDPDRRAHRWRLNIPVSVTGSKKRRLFFDSEREAKAKRDELLRNREGLSARTVRELADAGLTVESAIAFALAHAPKSTVTVDELAEEFQVHRREHVGVSARYMANLEGYVARIRAAFAKELLTAISEARILAFLAGLRGRDGVSKASPHTRNRYQETLAAMFNFAVQKRYLRDSPLSNTQKAISDEEDIEFLGVEEAEKLLRILEHPQHAEVAPAAIIQLFAAVRRAEIPHLRWELLGEKYLRLDRVKRGTRKRPVELPAPVLAWLAPYRKAEGYIFTPTGVDADRECLGMTDPASKAKGVDVACRRLEDAYSARLNQAARVAELSLSKNVLRHTAITMRLNSTGDLPGTARWAGNTPGVLEKHYLGYSSPDEASSFYAIAPSITP